MRQQQRYPLLIATVLAVTLACGLLPSADQPVVVTQTSYGTPVSVTTSPTLFATPTTAASTILASPTTAAPTPDLSRLLERSGAARIVLLTPTEGGGMHPRFEWQPVPGAARYTLLLLETDGRPYWAWEGAETAVYLGGGSEPPPVDSAGPILLRPMQWYVLAFDAEGKIIAYSEKQPIAP